MRNNQGKRVRKHGMVLDAIWDFLQFVCCLAANCGPAAGRMWTREKKNRVRTALFFFFFAYMVWIYNQGLYHGRNCFRYHGLVFFAVLCGITWVSREKKLTCCRWRSAVARCYLCFWLFTCVSDFVVSKRFKFVGYVMLLAMVSVFLAWRQMEQKEDLVRSFCRALELFAAAGVLYNILWNTRAAELPYRGYMKNAEEFGIFSAFLVLVFLAELYDCWKNERFGGAFLFYLCGASCSLLQAALSGKWFAMLYAGGIVLLAFAGAVKGYAKLSVSAKKKAAVCAAAAVLAAGLYFAAVRDASWDLHTVFTGENWGRRLQVAKANLKELNLFGHKQPNLKIGKKRRSPQNNILQIGYRYGLPAMLSYIALFGAALKKAVYTLAHTRKNWKSTDLLAAGVFVFWWTVGFFSNIEYPYYQPAWFFAYLMLGRYLACD